VTAFGAESLEAPDFAEALEAWRVWHVVSRKEGYRLGSVVKPTLWQPDEPLVARCLRIMLVPSWLRRRRGREHGVPLERCECGIYAGWLPTVAQYLDCAAGAPVALVLGQVSLWGTVIECERGFRASLAYPLRLFPPVGAAPRGKHRWDDIVPDLEAYGVPVEPLPAHYGDAVELVEQKLVSERSEREA
jgi:hypothetical protein